LIAIDTNLLVYAHRRGVPEHQAAQAAIARAAADARGWGLALSSAVEFWHVVTHPRAVGGPAAPAVATAYIDALRRAGARLWAPGPSMWERLSRAAERHAVQGGRIFDLQIALTALDGGATEMWTHDADFVRVRGLRLRDPLA